MNNDLWKQVEEALDARLDPFAVPALSEALAKDAEATRAVQLLVGRLSSLAAVTPTAIDGKSNRTRSNYNLAFLTAALIAVSLTAKLVWFSSSDKSLHLTPIRNVDTLSLVVESISPPPARFERIVFDTKTITTLTLEGESK